MKAFAWIKSSIGKTPVVTLKKSDSGLIVAKLERTNLTGSVKDRLVLKAIESALEQGYKGVIEATTGNTGISLAAIGSALGLEVTVIMPENSTLERKLLIRHYGAKLVLARDMREARELAEKLAEEESAFFLDQFKNPKTLEAGREVGRELAEWFLKKSTEPDNLVAGVGTGATLAGIAMELKKEFPKIKAYGITSIGEIDGTGDGVETPFIKSLKIDGWIPITREESIEKARYLAKLGLGVGISSGANILAAETLPGITATILPDSAERYFSSEMFVRKNERMFTKMNNNIYGEDVNAIGV